MIPSPSLPYPLQVYKNAEAAAAHREFAHFKLWTDFKVCSGRVRLSMTCAAQRARCQ